MSSSMSNQGHTPASKSTTGETVDPMREELAVAEPANPASSEHESVHHFLSQEFPLLTEESQTLSGCPEFATLKCQKATTANSYKQDL